MAYSDWEKYNKSKSQVSRKPRKKTSKFEKVIRNIYRELNGKQNTQNRKTKGTTPKKKVNSKKNKMQKVKQNVLVALALTALISGVAIASERESNSSDALDTKPGIIVNAETQKFEDFDEQEYLDYKEYCYYGEFAGEKFLFCPEEKILEMAEYSIDKLNAQFESSGMSKLSNGKYIPDMITPELIAGLCMTEGSYRVEKANGQPLGADRTCAASNRAEGMLQQKPGFVSDANNYSRNNGGKGYTLEDRYNPLKSIEITIINLTRIYRAYLTKDSPVYNQLGATNPNDDRLLMSMIIAYNQGEGSMQKWAASGKLKQVYNNPDSTSAYGASYYRTTVANMQEAENNMER